MRVPVHLKQTFASSCAGNRRAVADPSGDSDDDGFDRTTGEIKLTAAETRRMEKNQAQIDKLLNVRKQS